MENLTKTASERIIKNEIKCVCQRRHIFFIDKSRMSSEIQCPQCNSLVDSFELRTVR